MSRTTLLGKLRNWSNTFNYNEFERKFAKLKKDFILKEFQVNNQQRKFIVFLSVCIQ